MSDNIENVLASSQNLKDVASQLSEEVKMLDFQAIADLPPLEQAQIYSKLAYVTNSAMFAFVLASGVDPKTHAIMKDLDTVKAYMGKVAHAEGKPGPTKKDDRTSKLDMPAAKRIIFSQTEQPKRAISSDSIPADKPQSTAEAAEAFLKDVTKGKDKSKDKSKSEKKDKKEKGDKKEKKDKSSKKSKVSKPKK